MQSMRTENVRTNNLQLILKAALGADAPLSRAGIAEHVHLTRAGATRLVDELVTYGLLDEIPPLPQSGPGRPAVRLVGSHTRIGIGIDIGVDGVRIVATSLRGSEVARRTRIGDLTGSDPHAALTAIGRMVTSMIPQLKAAGAIDISGITISVPGLVAADSGMLLNAPNLGWHDVNVATLLQTTTPLLTDTRIPIATMNEANCAALNTAWQGPGRLSEVTTFAYLSGGIGIGAALVTDGILNTGYHGWAGEIGHLTVDPHGAECRCGSNGCLELYVGKKVIATVMDETPKTRELHAAIHGPAKALGIALAALVNLVDVPTIVLGGYLSSLLHRHGEIISATLKRRALAAKRHQISLQPCTGGEWSAARGASYQALEGVLANPQEPLYSLR